MGDHIIRSLSVSGGIRILVCDVALLTREICRLHGASPTVSIALGRGLAGGSLMGALLKPGQRLGLKFEANGPLRKMIVEADSDGAVRASVANPAAEAEPLAGRWNVAGVLGRAGFLTVSKDLGLGGLPYQGTVQLCSSEIGDDLAYYLADSEQTPSAVGLGAALAEDGLVSVCGGFLVQALPGVDEAERDRVMDNIASLPPLSSLLREGGPQKLLELLFDSVAYTRLETRELFFRCGCGRGKVERALLSLGGAELRDMGTREGEARVTCEFCRQGYRFDGDELEKLAKTADLTR
jgi:molecular chaperone Hsp33